MLPYVQRNWARILVSPSGTFTHGVPVRVLAFALIAAVITLVDRRGYHLRLPVLPLEVAGAVVALELTFRTNTGYARFWEGRTLWGAVVNSCRNVTRIVNNYARVSPEDSRAFAVWTVAFAHAMRRTLRGQDSYPELRELLPREEFEAFTTAHHPALFAADQLSRRLRGFLEKGAIEPLLAQQAEGEVVALVNNLGGCERIRKTPTPLGYVLLMQRFAAVWLATLPFALLGRAGAYTPLVTLFVAYPVMMIEALANELDNPFGHDANDLPLTRICTTIQKDLLGFAPAPEKAHSRGVED